MSPSDTHPLLRVRLTAASLRTSRTLRRHALATALLRRINRRTQRTTSATRSTRPARPAVAPSRAALPRRSYTPRHPRSDASLEVSVPCNAHWRRSRYPGRPASGRSRFGVSSHPSARAHTSFDNANLSDVRWVWSPLRFSALSGFVAMKLAWRTRFGPERSNRIRRSPFRRTWPRCGRAFAWRGGQLDDLLL